MWLPCVSASKIAPSIALSLENDSPIPIRFVEVRFSAKPNHPTPVFDNLFPLDHWGTENSIVSSFISSDQPTALILGRPPAVSFGGVVTCIVTEVNDEHRRIAKTQR